MPKKILKLAASGNKEEAQKLLPEAYKAVDKAAKKNLIHKNAAARKKSQLAKAVAQEV